jgi:hypothetical protein
MDYTKLKVRASSTHRICSYREKGTDLTPTQMKGLITFCGELETHDFFGFRPDITVDTMEKGIIGQSAAVTLYNLYLNESSGKKRIFKENKERLTNDYFTGEPDFYIGDSTRKCTEGFDTKCSKDISTFPRHKTELDDVYYWQNMVYIDLFGADRWTTVYALVNTPGYQLMRMKENLYYKMGTPDESSANFDRYIEKVISLEKNNIFDIDLFRRENPNTDLENKDWSGLKSPKDRIKEFVVERNESDIQFMRDRVTLCRNYMMSNFKN